MQRQTHITATITYLNIGPSLASLLCQGSHNFIPYLCPQLPQPWTREIMTVPPCIRPSFRLSYSCCITNLLLGGTLGWSRYFSARFPDQNMSGLEKCRLDTFPMSVPKCSGQGLNQKYSDWPHTTDFPISCLFMPVIDSIPFHFRHMYYGL
jgi:hypothetical protein